jgi:WD40 repeat protein
LKPGFGACYHSCIVAMRFREIGNLGRIGDAIVLPDFLLDCRAGHGAVDRSVQTIELADIRSTVPDVSAGELAKNLTTTRIVGVPNHFDHLTPDLKNNRLFVVPEDNKSVEVYDIRSGKFIHSIKGIGVGHSVVWRPDIDRIFITDGADGDLKIYNGTTYELLKSVKLLADSDATGYDPNTHYVYIADGGLDAKLNYTFLEIVNTDTGEKEFHRRDRPQEERGRRGLAAHGL